MEPGNQEQQCQENKMCPESIVEIFSQPRLNEIDSATLGIGSGMNGPRPAEWATNEEWRKTPPADPGNLRRAT
jgi:hypothetical protein